MAMTADPQIEITRRKFTICEQATIDRLVGWINGDSDALTCLQTVYNSSTSSETNKVKAAAGAIGYERPRMATTASLVVVDFRERVRQARLRAPLAEPKTIEHIP
jgi:hypothetical protein